MRKRHIDERARELYGKGKTYGELERLAGVADRMEFWRDKDEPQARAALLAMIRRRVEKGELP